MSNIIEWLVLGGIFLGLPTFPWLIVGYIMGVEDEYFPTSFWVYVCELASVYLIPFGVILYNKIKNRNRIWAAFAMAVCLALIIPSIIFIGNDISFVREKRQTFEQWENSTLVSCQSFNKETSSLNGDIRIKEQIWMMVNGRIYGSDRDQLLQHTPEEWNNTVRTIAIIKESYRETGETYVEDNLSKSPTGIRAVQYTWNVSICDLENKHIIAENVFVGPEPPEKISLTVRPEIYGITPVAEYQTWIDTLTYK